MKCKFERPMLYTGGSKCTDLVRKCYQLQGTELVVIVPAKTNEVFIRIIQGQLYALICTKYYQAN